MTSVEQIWAGSADGVLHNVRQEGREHEGDGKGEVGDFLCGEGRSGDEVVEDENGQRSNEGVYEEPD